MTPAQRIDALLDQIATIVLEEISASGEISRVELTDRLGMKHCCALPTSSTKNPKSWLMNIAARRLIDAGKITYRKEGSRTFYNTI